MTEHISCDCKCKFNSATYNSNQKWNNKTCQCECKDYRTLSGIKVQLFFKKKTSKKSTCAVMIRIIIIFKNQIFL